MIAGIAKGRRLIAPKGDLTRPTSDFVREAIFNALQSVVDLDGATVADLFAGTGALGIEALSRGASSCVFVERDRAALDAIRANLAATRLPGGTVVGADAVAWLRQGRGPFDVVFADPPYSFDAWPAIAGLDAGLIVAESDREIALTDAWGILRSRRYGSTVVTLLSPLRTERSSP